MEAKLIEEKSMIEKLVGKVVNITETAFEKNFKIIESVCNDIYPDCWDLAETTEETLKKVFPNNCKCNHCLEGESRRCATKGVVKNYRLVLKFPYTVIKNSRGQTQIIEDFYIAISFNEDLSKVKYNKLFSFRGTVSSLEYACGMFHPHSGTRNNNSSLEDYFSWRNMCLGGSTALTDVLYTLTKDGLSKKSLHELCILLYVYAGWESIEGGPYRSIGSWGYPGEYSSRRSYSFPIEELYPIFVDYLFSSDKVLVPEIGRNINDYAITNVNVFGVILKEMIVQEITNNKFNSVLKNKVLAHLGTSNGLNFEPLYHQHISTNKSIAFYETTIKATEKLSSSFRATLLKFNNKPIDLTIKLEPNGLIESSSEITIDQIKASTISNSALSSVVRNYLQKFWEYEQYQIL
jgi:hypothetical protein